MLLISLYHLDDDVDDDDDDDDDENSLVAPSNVQLYNLLSPNGRSCCTGQDADDDDFALLHANDDDFA